MSYEMTLTLNSPITEEQWDMIEDVDFDHTDSITFHTKHGKEVEFVKRKTGEWIEPSREGCLAFDYKAFRECSVCGKKQFLADKMNYCPHCGADMKEVEHE